MRRVRLFLRPGGDKSGDCFHIEEVASDLTRQQKECAVPKTYRYTHANLDNVHLMNGFFVDDDPDMGECVGIERINDMNDRLRDIMIVQAPYLDGAQLYWLRTELGLDRGLLARLMNMSAAAIEQMEERPRVPLPSYFDDAFRHFFCKRMGLHGYAGSWMIQSEHHDQAYSIRLAIEGGRWVGHIAP